MDSCLCINLSTLYIQIYLPILFWPWRSPQVCKPEHWQLENHKTHNFLNNFGMGGSHQIPLLPHAIQVTNQLKILMSSGQFVGGKLSTKCNVSAGHPSKCWPRLTLLNYRTKLGESTTSLEKLVREQGY